MGGMGKIWVEDYKNSEYVGTGMGWATQIMTHINLARHLTAGHRYQKYFFICTERDHQANLRSLTQWLVTFNYSETNSEMQDSHRYQTLIDSSLMLRDALPNIVSRFEMNSLKYFTKSCFVNVWLMWSRGVVRKPLNYCICKYPPRAIIQCRMYQELLNSSPVNNMNMNGSVSSQNIICCILKPPTQFLLTQ